MRTKNKITIGDRVYVGGLIGKEYNGINNKTGTIKKILSSSTTKKIINIADVNIDGVPVPINFHYLFKIKNNNIIINNNIITNSNIQSNFSVFDVVEYKLGIIETGESQCICITKQDGIVNLMLTTSN